MQTLSYPHIGNVTLLRKRKVAFLASSHISTLSVLPTLEWAAQMAHREDVAVVSGFSSHMEKEVVHVLLRGKCGIILVLSRQHYKVLSKVWQKPLADNRLLIISTSKQTRQSRQSAFIRNEHVCEIADEVVMPNVPIEESWLYTIYKEYEKTNRLKILL